MRWRNRIISKVKSNYWRTTNKFGISFTKTVEEAFRFDKEAGNYYWERAPNKEISKLKVVWQQVGRVTPEQARSGLVKELIGNQYINYHIIFDAHMDFQ